MERKLKLKFGKKLLINQENERVDEVSSVAADGTVSDDMDELQRSKLSSILGEKSNINEMKNDDFERLEEIGWGSSGVVYKVNYKPKDMIMAQKIIRLLVKQSVLVQITRELQVLKKCDSQYIVSYYGAYQHQGEIYILMEYMEYGSLDKLGKLTKRVPEDILSRIVHDVLQGLSYLRTHQKVIHRDIKPSNILINFKGEVKICDFGVSGMLIDSMANTFVGTRSYMAPERLQGKKYTVRSDIWSIGVLMVELATGRFPYPPIPGSKLEKLLEAKEDDNSKPNISNTEDDIAIFELLDYIVNDDPPKLPEKYFSPQIIDFVSKCLVKNPAERADLTALLEHEYILKFKTIDLKQWVENALQLSK